MIEERQELLNSINNFLDETVVLPPGDWDRKNLLSMADIMELKRKKRIRLAAIAKMKKENAEQKASDEVGEHSLMLTLESRCIPGSGKRCSYLEELSLIAKSFIYILYYL